ncbi:MAG: hypothetical protein RBR54_01760 [Sulfurimonas sp.]|jgi:hypothetical protein|nr:hypothetical protein [Sulfurimonas sp.]
MKLQLKYVGPKPIISHHGVTFDNNKVDKFDYLNIVLQLLNALDHEYIQEKTYTYDTTTKRLDNKALIEELYKYCPDIDSVVDDREHMIEEDIAKDLQDAKENTVLSAIDKQTLENNITIMHDYLVQRAINKSVYYYAIEQLANLVRKNNLEYIIVPMYEKFVHILHSLQGVLKKQKYPLETKLDIYQEEGKLLAKLEIIRN